MRRQNGISVWYDAKYIYMCYQMETFSVLLALCGEYTGHRWIPLTKASSANSDVFIDLRLNKRLSKQSGLWWFETLSRSSYASL